MRIASRFKLQSIAYSFKTRVTLPTWRALRNPVRYWYISNVSWFCSGGNVVIKRLIVQLRSSLSGSRMWLHIRMARPITCSSLFKWYQLSNTKTSRIKRKSIPSDATCEPRTTFTISPRTFASARAISTERLLFGEYSSRPVSKTYFAAINLCDAPWCVFSFRSHMAHWRPSSGIWLPSRRNGTSRPTRVYPFASKAMANVRAPDWTKRLYTNATPYVVRRRRSRKAAFGEYDTIRSSRSQAAPTSGRLLNALRPPRISSWKAPRNPASRTRCTISSEALGNIQLPAWIIVSTVFNPRPPSRIVCWLRRW